MERPISNTKQTQTDAPLKVLIAGMTHGHVDWILARDRSRQDIQIVGVQDKNLLHAQYLAQKFNISSEKVFNDLDVAISILKPDGIFGFGALDEHLEVVRSASRFRVPVMLEKPLAHSLADALEIERVSTLTNTLVLINYETTWYPALERTLALVSNPKFLNSLHKVEFQTGHRGPAQIGVKPEFLSWLTNPQRGGGALFDFACYGVNILTALLEGKFPQKIKALKSCLQPEHYPSVEDQAILSLEYENGLQAVVQASWNWPSSRKKSTFYSDHSEIIQIDRNNYSVQTSLESPKQFYEVAHLSQHETYDDAFSYFAAVLKGRIKLSQWDLSGLKNSVQVMQILDTAHHQT